ncbi:hypothetical protein CXB51_001539 [Gossypium anomalum]|uniref:Reverse transcriptase Ty1/copia-type domain-containing protein n=1 Tax=Gossypium anomalum TaxID=47600 RepID=A0A8J6D9N6_9ROSI|nr:hypothetical protein CXB51_001539 [Gossypium anomalum]
MKVDRTIDKFKVRLVAKGFTQKQGIDYFDTYAPVARIVTIRLLISLTSLYNLVVHQMDVKTAFLNGELEEEMYMEQPEGFVVLGQEHKVCIAYAVGKLSRYTSNTSSLHWQALNRVLRYLKKTINYGLCYNGYPSVLEGYSGASWITSLEDHASTSGWIFILGGRSISWGSKKQTCITDSTMATEFIALVTASKEAEWLRNLLYDVPLWPKPFSPISICCDSEATLVKAYSQVYNGKSRHTGLRHSYVR